MASFNRIILIGNLTRDPEYKLLASGQALCRLGIATNRQFKNKQNGSMVQEVCFIDVDVWGAQAESCRQYLQKGRHVLVEGRLKYDSWEDQNGQMRSRHTIVSDRVVFLSSQGGATIETDDQSRSASDASAEEPVMQLNPNNPVERDLLQQLEQAKNKIQSAVKEQPVAKPKKTDTISPTAASAATGEIDFKDEPPFEDQLPF
jgi:single-strand DNA-binding protein